MDLWLKARAFAEDAAKKSPHLATFSAAVSEASKRSKELAAEASKRSHEFAADALKRADEIKAQIPPAAVVLNNIVDSSQKAAYDPADLERFGVTDELREFVRGITTNTFRDFPLEDFDSVETAVDCSFHHLADTHTKPEENRHHRTDEPEVSDIPTVSNIRQDLTEWQEKHAKLVLLTVKEISKLRYQLCPRVMKERKFWKIYFILVNSHLVPYERHYMDNVKLKAAENAMNTEVEGTSSRSEGAHEISKSKSNTQKSSSIDKDLDVFLLGDPEDSDDDPGDGNDDSDDGFEKL